MDWYLISDDAQTVTALRHEIRNYLRRHAEVGSDVWAAELIVQELVVNACEHASGPVWVRLSWTGDEPELEVRDLGSGFDLGDESGLSQIVVPINELDSSSTAAAPFIEDEVPDLTSSGGRGLFLVAHLASNFARQNRPGGGALVAAQLPVRRAAAPRVDPRTPPLAGALPALDEADAAGGFGKEAFLRALVVQLSQAVELAGGPTVSEHAVAQVGLTVGGQMEAAYRVAEGLTEALSPEQLADCYVRLKHAIDGRFHVVEISDTKIVLTNSRCPFGNAVRKAPALCRMTSSVFGGIAARNSGGSASVVLEERIAVGDPGCRVVVHLGPRGAGDGAAAQRFAHDYQLELA